MKPVPATLLPLIEIHHTDLARLIQSAYGFAINVETSLGHKAASVEFDARGRLLESRLWQERAATVRRGKRTGNINLLLNMLAVDGFIHPARWIVRLGPQRMEQLQPGGWSGKLVKLRIAVG